MASPEQRIPSEQVNRVEGSQSGITTSPSNETHQEYLLRSNIFHLHKLTVQSPKAYAEAAGDPFSAQPTAQ
jgi:hypothetical protein